MFTETSADVSGQLFIRNFYSDLFEAMWMQFVKPYQVILSGTPGVGKSAFRNYFLARLIQKAKIAKENMTILFCGGLGTCLSFVVSSCDDGNEYDVKVYTVASANIETYALFLKKQHLNFCYLYDATRGKLSRVDDVPPEKLFIFSSPSEPLMKSINRNDPSACRFLMPIWNLEELDLMWSRLKNANLSEKQIELLTQYGMIPRYLFLDEFRLGKMKAGIRTTIATLAANKFSMNKEFSRIMLSSFGENGSFLYSDRKVQLGTYWIFQQITVQFYKNRRDWFTNIGINVLTRDALGRIFEMDVITTIEKGATLVYSMLPEKNTLFKLDIPASPINFFSNITEVVHVGFWVPKASNFTVIDAVLVTTDKIICIQITVAPKHDINKKFEITLNHFESSMGLKQLSFVFIVDAKEIAVNFDPAEYSGNFEFSQCIGMVKSNFSENVNEFADTIKQAQHKSQNTRSKRAKK